MTTRKEGAAERAYRDLRVMAIAYDIKPGERINEVTISKQLGVSRTPLREALNRLETEGFMVFSPQLGFFRRKLEIREIMDLIETRAVLETAGIRFAVLRASDEQISNLRDIAERIAGEIEGKPAEEVVALDETFHEHLLELSGNLEMLKRLRIVNARIRFIRWGDVERPQAKPTVELHRELVEALERRASDEAASLMERQILRTLEEITEAVKLGYAKIFMRDELRVTAAETSTS